MVREREGGREEGRKEGKNTITFRSNVLYKKMYNIHTVCTTNFFFSGVIMFSTYLTAMQEDRLPLPALRC
jgi:hypothetical protein